jgi:hypothetical protein
MSPYTVIDYPIFEDVQNHETRYFWDGAFLSNTPLREVLETVGLDTYSNSQPTVSPHNSIFEMLWMQAEMQHRKA